MIQLTVFNKSEVKLIHLANLWNFAESQPQAYDVMFVSNPHELATLIGQGTNYQTGRNFYLIVVSKIILTVLFIPKPV